MQQKEGADHLVAPQSLVVHPRNKVFPVALCQLELISRAVVLQGRRSVRAVRHHEGCRFALGQREGTGHPAGALL